MATNIPTMQVWIRITRNTQSQAYMLSLTEYTRESQNDAYRLTSSPYHIPAGWLGVKAKLPTKHKHWIMVAKERSNDEFIGFHNILYFLE